MTEQQQKRVGPLLYLLAAMGFIPGIGIFFSIAAIIVGIDRRKAGGIVLIVLGVLGSALTVGIYGTLFYKAFVERDGFAEQGFKQIAKMHVTDLVSQIEFRKITNGAYPIALEELQQSNKLVQIVDVSSVKFFSSQAARNFFYQLSEDKAHYYLLGVGEDGVPFTADDIFPDISERDRLKTGLLIKTATRK